MSDRYIDDLKLAQHLADEADKLTLRWFGSKNLQVELKSDETPVTRADRAVEQMIIDTIAEQRPEDSVLGEEFGEQKHKTRRWIIDPIDGTRNYAHANPVYGTLIALEERGELIVSVVSAPSLSKRWHATLGGGSWSNGSKLHVSSVSKLNDAYLSYGSLSWWQQTGTLDKLMALIDKCGRQRAFGDFWQHMLVAEGAVDIALDQGGGLHIWDIAAPRLIVQEAGGTVTNLHGGTDDKGDLLSSNGIIHDQVVKLLTSQQ